MMCLSVKLVVSVAVCVPFDSIVLYTHTQSFQRSPRNKSSMPFPNASTGHRGRIRFAVSRLCAVICLSYLKTSESFNRSINIATVIYPHHCGPCNFTACNEASKWERKAKVESKVFIILIPLNDTVCWSHKLFTHTEHARTHSKKMWSFHPKKATDQLAVAICVGINWVMSKVLLRRSHNRHFRLVRELHVWK
jgi:hypothetical protein